MHNLYRLFTEIPANLRIPLAIALGAIPGALGRYYASLVLSHWFGNDFPYATVLVNFSGAVGMGIVVTLITHGNILSPDLGLLLAVGFLGSYTTFSTYALEVTVLWRSGQLGQSLLYGLGSIVLGVIGVILGGAAARRWT